MIRVSVCLNAGSGKGQPAATVVVAPETEPIVTAAANKLRTRHPAPEHSVECMAMYAACSRGRLARAPRAEEEGRGARERIRVEDGVRAAARRVRRWPGAS